MGIYLNEEYLEEHGGARNKYIKMQVEKEKKAIDDHDKAFNTVQKLRNERKSSSNPFTKIKKTKEKLAADKVARDTFDKAQAIQFKNKKYTGRDIRDYAYYNIDPTDKFRVSSEPADVLNGKYDENNRAFSKIGKKRFNKDFGGPNKGRDYERAKYPKDTEWNKIAIKDNLKRKGLIKEACEYILDMLDEEYYYDEYEDQVI